MAQDTNTPFRLPTGDHATRSNNQTGTFQPTPLYPQDPTYQSQSHNTSSASNPANNTPKSFFSSSGPTANNTPSRPRAHTRPPSAVSSLHNTPPGRSRPHTRSHEVLHPHWHGHSMNTGPYATPGATSTPFRSNSRNYNTHPSFEPSPDTFVESDESYEDQHYKAFPDTPTRLPLSSQIRLTGTMTSAQGPPPMMDHQSFEPHHHPREYYDNYYMGGPEGYGHPHIRRPNYDEGMSARPSKKEVLTLPWTMWMNSESKNHFVAGLGEFVGTFMFLFFAYSGTQVANVGSRSSESTTTNASAGFSPIVLLYTALCFSFSLLVNVWVFFRVSGGLFNPAVTLVMLLTRAVGFIRALVLLVTQLLGAIFASYIVKVLFPTPLNVATTLSAETSLVRGVFIEAILTAQLVFTILMLAKEKHKATFIAPVGIGLSLFIAELVGVYYTGGSLNPARSLGPCVVMRKFDPEHWIYWVGPGIGALIAMVFYQMMKMLEYEAANPAQDSENENDDTGSTKTEKTRIHDVEAGTLDGSIINQHHDGSSTIGPVGVGGSAGAGVMMHPNGSIIHHSTNKEGSPQPSIPASVAKQAVV